MIILLLGFTAGTGLAGSAIVNGGGEDGSLNGWGKSLAIYKIEGSTLTISANAPGVLTRPTTFTPIGGTRVFVLQK